MLNLLGPDTPAASQDQGTPLPAPTPRSQLHWYGKAELRPGRKLGHLNGTAESPEALASLIAELESSEARWLREMAK
jgi:5-(carboxyamino)imidazole ribonucleotide synthase